MLLHALLASPSCLLLCNNRCFVCLYALQPRSSLRNCSTHHPTSPSPTSPPPLPYFLHRSVITPTSRNPENSPLVCARFTVGRTNCSTFPSRWIISESLSILSPLTAVLLFCGYSVIPASFRSFLFRFALQPFCQHISLAANCIVDIMFRVSISLVEVAG